MLMLTDMVMLVDTSVSPVCTQPTAASFMVDSLTPLASVTLKLSLDLDTVPPLEFTPDTPSHTATGLLRELMDSATTVRGLLSQDTAMAVATSSSPVALEVPQDLSDTSTEFTLLDT